MSAQPLRPPPPVVRAPVVDSHCHLDPEEWGGDDGVDAVVDRAFAAGLSGLVVVGAGVSVMDHAVLLAARHGPRVRAVVGIHPHEARYASPAALAQVEALARRPEVVAVGEVGLDFHYDFSPPDDQRAALTAQVALARRLQKPLVIHDRESGGETFAILAGEGAFGGAGVLFHCFSGTPREADRLLEHGGYLSIPGIVTYAKADRMREVAARVPTDRYLVETDAPYLAPEPWRGHRNEPAWVLYTVAAVARIRAEPAEVVARTTTLNAVRFFDSPGLAGQEPWTAPESGA
ncbi:MAG: TatD family hydrolase [Deltaproteobacteria bacterium]|nr:TatD family hydrolase [Deltaproteobacteria bacterium]